MSNNNENQKTIILFGLVFLGIGVYLIITSQFWELMATVDKFWWGGAISGSVFCFLSVILSIIGIKWNYFKNKF